MRAVAVEFQGPRRVELRDVEVGPPNQDEVLVRTLLSGLSSGTEMLAYRGELDSSVPLDETLGALGGTFSYPFRYGYSCVGVVEGGSAEGDGVVFCFHPHQSLVVCPRRDVVDVGGVDPSVAVMFPLVETALQISSEVRVMPGDQVAVMGLGVVGMLTASLLARGGAEVAAFDPKPWRREIAARLDLAAFDPVAAPETVERLSGGAGIPFVVEASGNPEALAPSLRLLGHEGTALVASWYGSKPVSLRLGAEFHRRRLSIRSTQVSSIPASQAGRWTIERRRSVARDLLDELPLKILATHEFAITEVARAFEAVDRCDEGLMHAALRYDEGSWDV